MIIQYRLIIFILYKQKYLNHLSLFVNQKFYNKTIKYKKGYIW